ncbi:hypothetical protein ARTSIC4J27_4305 [Pseudarthrobacter siccitolerans]|uniref:Uncharacterized protein n=1 Tax=Pseudarthrobacter siccitolerans TaxID=861266 RepID=A0A024H8T9_9MICC|nr:hypothetical protein ARTSIC4J27_4305 [Pseudarthrobacter siccitolerans]
MWIVPGDIQQNSCRLAGKALSRDELQTCKLPTLWIKAVDKKGPGIRLDAGTFF